MKRKQLKSDLGSRLKYMRKSKNITQEQFAEMLGVSRTAVAKWENGYSEPSIQNIIKISEIFCVTSDYLLGINRRKVSITAEISDEATAALNLFINEIKRQN